MKNDSGLAKKRVRYTLITVYTISILAAMTYSYYSNFIMINKYSPLVDATMEAKFEVTLAHLWFEEKMTGDRYEDFDEIINHIHQAMWYTTAMLKGGQTTKEKIIPLTDKRLRQEVSEAFQLLEEFLDITHKRYGTKELSGIGTRIDQQYDGIFRRFVSQIDDVGTLLQQKIARDYQKHKNIQLMLIFILVTSGIFGIFIQYRFDKNQEIYIKELREARQKAEESENWLVTTMNSMGDAVIITDHTGKITYLNPVASNLTGWLLNDAENRDITEVFHIVNEFTKEPVKDPVKTVIKKNVVIGLANHTELISKDGKVWPISDSAAPIFDSRKNLRGVVVVFHEITEQKKAQAEKINLENQLRQAFKMEAIGTMAGGIAHDFNNILAIILGNADMAYDDVPRENPAKHNIEEILTAAHRAKELIKQILTFSRQEKHKKIPCCLSRIVKEGMKSLRPTIPASVEQCIEIAPENEDIIIFADAIQIHQLLLNLCVNAVQAMDEKGRLTVGVTRVTVGEESDPDKIKINPGEYGYLRFSDNGPGIRSEYIDRIFDPFFTTKEVGEGTGMGLSVVHGIVENHQGNIYVESEPGNGAVFHIYFPITRKKTVEKITNTAPLPAGDETILLVDDEKMIVEMAKEMISRQGYTVVALTDSLKALELVQRFPDRFDLVISDQTMPNLTGGELAERLLKNHPDLPIILCSGYSSKMDEARALEIGVSAFAQKPLKRKEILNLIRDVLDNT
ncbi:MAG: response regulator [Desulfobacterales bacterium]|nr:response regulator [Desulfobacterales bacterium]